MAQTIVKETIELESIICDANGNAFINKRINLQEGKLHALLQVDMYQDRYPLFDPAGIGVANNVVFEVVISAYPAIPTNMDFRPGSPNSFPAAGDDSILFKEIGQFFQTPPISSIDMDTRQFPSPQIAAANKSYFYTDHLYINMVFRGSPNVTYEGLGYSFLFVLDNKNASSLEHSLGVLSESHNAMCAQLMSNGRMTTVDTLRGNVFPMWRYGGIRPEAMIPPLAANSFFLPLSNRDEEEMMSAPTIRTAVADARQMNTFDGALGPRRPDWLREFLNAGLISGAVRPNPIPLRYADNGNTRMF